MTKANDSKMDTIWYDAARRHRGSINEIAEQTGNHRNWVRAVLKGESADADLLLEASKILLAKESATSEHRKRMKELEEKMVSLRPTHFIPSAAMS
jgi:predicted transcriptional regulator